jgi:hypothetical protein
MVSDVYSTLECMISRLVYTFNRSRFAVALPPLDYFLFMVKICLRHELKSSGKGQILRGILQYMFTLM